MRFLGFLALLVLAACSPRNNGLPSIGTQVAVDNPNAIFCMTHDAEMKLVGYATAKNRQGFASMLLGGGGMCLGLRGQKVVVTELDPKNLLVGVRLADSPNGGTIWTYWPTLTTSAGPSTSDRSS